MLRNNSEWNRLLATALHFMREVNLADPHYIHQDYDRRRTIPPIRFGVMKLEHSFIETYVYAAWSF